MTIIAIDPHIIKTYAYSIWKDQGLYDYGNFDNMKEFQAILYDEKPDKVLIEDQYLAKNFNTAKKLTISAGKVFGLCELNSIECVSINVATWKSKIPELQKFDKDRSLSTYKRKKAKEEVLICKAKEVIVSRFGVAQDIDEDIASAVLIGYTMGT